MSENISRMLKIIIILAGALSIAFFCFTKVISLEIDEPCPDVMGIPIVSEVGHYWVKLAGHEERLMLGGTTKLANMPGSNSSVRLVSLAEDKVSFIISHLNHRLVDDEKFTFESYRIHCQATFSGSDPVYQTRDPAVLLKPEDFSPNWEFSGYSEFVSKQTYSHVGKYNDTYVVYMRAQNDSNSYMIWLRHFEFSSSELAKLEFLSSKKNYRSESTQNYSVAEDINSFVWCSDDLTECRYLIQTDEHFQSIRMGFLGIDSAPDANSITIEDWQYIVELATNKFLSAIEE